MNHLKIRLDCPIDGGHLCVQCRCAKIVDENAFILDKNNNTKIPFYDVFFKMKDTKNGVHNPLGMFWFYDKSKEHAVIRRAH